MNYLGTDLRWYSAIRVPPSYDPRIQKLGLPSDNVQALERQALLAIREYERKTCSLESALSAVM